TLDAPAPTLRNPHDTRTAVAVVNAGDSLTIGPDITIRGGAGTVGGSASSTFVNRGTIIADTFGTAISLSGLGWNNLGTLQTLDGTLNLDGTNWTNNGTISGIGGAANFAGVWTNFRPMAFVGCVVNFRGTGSNPANLT